MSILEWAGLAVAVVTIITSFLTVIRFLVLHYLAELKPNSGSSMRDTVDRLEVRVDEIYKILLNKSLS